MSKTSDVKSSPEWQEQQWKKWSTPADWPGALDIYEAAAFRRVHPDTVRKACIPGRDGKARLRHQRFGTQYRIQKDDLSAFGVVQQRQVA